MQLMISKATTLVAPNLIKPTANQNIMLVLKGKRMDGATWLRLVVSSSKKQDSYHRSFYKPSRHRDGGVDAWLSKDYFQIKGGKVKSA